MSLSPSSWPRPSPRCSVTNLLKPCLFGLLQLRSVPYPSSLSWRKGLSEIGRQWKLHSAAQKATAKPKAKSINSSVSKDKCMDEPSLIYYANGCCSVDELSRKVRQTHRIHVVFTLALGVYAAGIRRSDSFIANMIGAP